MKTKWNPPVPSKASTCPATSVIVDEGGEANDLVYRLLAYHFVFEEGGFVGA